MNGSEEQKGENRSGHQGGYQGSCLCGKAGQRNPQAFCWSPSFSHQERERRAELVMPQFVDMWKEGKVSPSPGFEVCVIFPFFGWWTTHRNKALNRKSFTNNYNWAAAVADSMKKKCSVHLYLCTFGSRHSRLWIITRIAMNQLPCDAHLLCCSSI